MNRRNFFARLCPLALVFFAGIAATAMAQTNQYSRPTQYSNNTNGVVYQPCGGSNYTVNTSSMQNTYMGKSGAGPIRTPYAEMSVSGFSSSSPGEGLQTYTMYSNFMPITGTVQSLTLNYAVQAIAARCAYVSAVGTLTTGALYNSGVISYLNASCYGSGCSISLPSNIILSTLQFFVCIQATSTTQSQPAQALVADVWLNYVVAGS